MQASEPFPNAFLTPEQVENGFHLRGTSSHWLPLAKSTLFKAKMETVSLM